MRSLESTAPLRPTGLPWQGSADGALAPVAGPEKPAWIERFKITYERAWRWEFWPWWLYYVPIAAWIVWLGVKHRSPMAFTAANPILEAGGMAGERKHDTLVPLQVNAPDLVATFAHIQHADAAGRIEQALALVQITGLPVVLKPDVGQRGRGVFIARDEAGLRDYLTRFKGDVIAQRYIDGDEFGIFVARAPGETLPRVLSIVHKTFPTVHGDGQQTLRELILGDARAKLISAMLFKRWADQLGRVPVPGEAVKLVELGTHSRGSVFLNACHLTSPELQATLQRLLDAVPGFAFGRLDLRAPSTEHLRQGRGLQVLEINGVSAESAHIYHPGTPLLEGYRVMFHQWSTAFDIGKAYSRQGVPTTSPLELLRQFRLDVRRGETWF